VNDSYEIPPERLQAWLERWDTEHATTWTRTRPGQVTFTGADGATLLAEPPFPPLVSTAAVDGFAPERLLAHVRRDRIVGVLLVRLGGYAAGVFDGRRLVESKVGARNVHGRHRAGGQSQRRYERRREGQARQAGDAAADTAVKVLLGHLDDLDAVVLGGDRFALAAVLEDPRLRKLAPLTSERVLDVGDPKLAVLRALPDRFRATILNARPAAHDTPDR
jgi:peptide subunit release factor 1 (eRF1)